MKTRKRTLLVPLLIAASAPLISAAATADQAAAKAEDPATAQSTASKDVAPQSAAPDSSGLQEVVVTAERRTSGVQKTAAAVSVRKGDDLLQQGKISIRQILEDVPAVVVTENTGPFIAGSDTAGNNVTIRGIKSNGSSAGSPLPAVPTTALYTDGVYEGIGGNYDLDRIEILRGPQGTLYGRSATSGVVAAYTKNPGFGGFEADVTAEFGSYSLRHFSGAVNVSASDTLALRIAADEFSRDGYDSAEGGALKRTSGRVKMLYKPNSDLSVLFGAAIEQNKTHTGGAAASLTGPDTFLYTPAPVRAGSNNFKQYWLNLDWNLGSTTLTYLPAVRQWDQDAVIYQNGPGGGGLNQTIKTPSDQFTTHEVRLASNGTGAMRWLLGSFFYDNRLHSTNDIRWLSSNGLLNESDTHKNTNSTGVFGEMTYAFLDTWRVTGGLRHDNTRVKTVQDYTNNLNYSCNTPIAPSDPVTHLPTDPNCLPAPPGLPNAGAPENDATLSLTGDAGARKFSNTTYKLRFEHDLSNANLVYAMVSTGFIPGDVQVAAGAGGAPAASEYGAEQLTAYEFGSKNRFLNNKLQVNGDVFYYDYGGFRTSIRPDPRNPGSQILLTVPAKVLGAELEMQYLLTRQDQLSLSYSYTDAYFTNPPALFTANVAETHAVPGAIPHMFNAAYRHAFTLPGNSTIDFRASARFEAAHNLDNISAQMGQAGLAYVRVADQWTGNLSSSWSSSDGDYSVTAYVRNLTNNRYKTFAQLQLLQPFVVASGTQYEPRTFGVVLTARY
jgi:iron complex outermembrane receptor protein